MSIIKPVFSIIELDKWPRNETFDYYYQRVKCTYSITAEIEISSLLKVCKEKSVKLYPAMIYIITTVINQMDELRISYNEQGQLGMWNFMSPSYTVFHDDDKTFSNIWTPYTQNFADFNRNYVHDIDQYGNIRKFIAKDAEPDNTYPLSCIPWVDFTAFNLNIHDDASYLCPIFTIGKYMKRGNKIFIPLSVQLHHAICDGYHAGVLFEKIRKSAADPNSWFLI